MKNLSPLRNYKSYYTKIAKSKRKAARVSLALIETDVLDRFDLYLRHVTHNNLELITHSPFSPSEKKHLRSCYNLDLDEMAKLEKKIKDFQSDFLIAECQYCNIGTPETLDHYLPKGKFPEFATFSKNLIPCCWRCNLDKKEKFLTAGVRSFINIYYDTLPNVEYLRCTIIYRHGNPIACFDIIPNRVLGQMNQIVINHYKYLGLFEKFRHRSNTYIGNIRQSIMQNLAITSRQQAIDFLNRECVIKQNSHGINHWHAILYKGLASSNDFLVQCGY